jgi:GxxExxY protein
MYVDTALAHRDLTEQVIGLFYEVYNELGRGFLESLYEQALAIACDQAGLRVERQRNSVSLVSWNQSRRLQGRYCR